MQPFCNKTSIILYIYKSVAINCDHKSTIMKRNFEWDLSPKEKGGYYIFDFLCICVVVLALAGYQSSNKIALESINFQNMGASTQINQSPLKSKILPILEDKKANPEPRKTKFDDYSIAVWYLKSKEGLRLASYPDGYEKRDRSVVKRYSNGWGTRSTLNDTITIIQANQELVKAFEKRYYYIDNVYPHLTRWQKLIFATVRYNVGNFHRHGLHKAIKAGDKEGIVTALKKYNTTSQGEVLKGLTLRRMSDIEMLYMSEEEKQKSADLLQKIIQKKIDKLK